MDPGNQDSFSSLEVIFYNYWHRMEKKKKRGGKEREKNRKRKAVCVSKETIFVFVENYTHFAFLPWDGCCSSIFFFNVKKV